MRSNNGAERATGILLRNAASRNGAREGTLLIDNGDGSGARDYSHAVLADRGLKIERTLNEPTCFTCDVLVGPESLPLPQRRARVVVKGDEGQTLFTGYLATEPTSVYTGAGAEGCSYRATLHAISDEWLLDKLGPAGATGGRLSLGLDAREVLKELTRQVGGSVQSISDAGGTTFPLGALELAANAGWSVQAGHVAGAAYASLRALDGTISLQPAGSVVHEFSDVDGTLSLADFRASPMRGLANDVTVSGELEPTTFVTEVFLGDGVMSEFALSEPAFRDSDGTLLDDSFAGTTVDTRQWVLNDAGGHLSVTSAGLTMSGGNGVDGATTLTALNAIEMGGSVLAALRGVTLHANSAGMLAGFYSGDTVLATCFAGFRVRQSSGSTVIVPVVSGAEVGTVFSVVEGHRYTLRLRLHCAEVQRVMQRYNVMVDGVVQTYGAAGAVGAAMDVAFELIDEGQAATEPATVLYDSAAGEGSVAVTPATCIFAAVNSEQMYGSVASVAVSRPNTFWVESTLPNGTKQTRLIGSLYEGADCSVSAGNAASGPGAVKFFPGRTPTADEQIQVRYRASGRAIARTSDAASIAAEAVAGAPGTSRWVGKVLQPPARSSADCATAAQAVLAFSTSRSAALAGTYACSDPTSDVWPGDVLRMTIGGVTTALLVRGVAITEMAGRARYTITFANDWGAQPKDGLGLRLSEAVASDVALPAIASDAGSVLTSLGGLQVNTVSETSILLDAGMDAPAGGGFEVRRRDGGFGSSDVDLVVRSPVRTFSLPRSAQVERFFVRTYDASVPVKYSRVSAAVLVNVPVG